ncbi:hypothetical protein B0G81_6817 [Paraburkholderia sp. BL6665CI2N2]|uniref:hypothetical protein n=1 Tax=Paraburkholderia sp. BL6665CI2N2 TaxID=1938806 RepID=UPI0010668F23|nr:hypothetical protein [Paraburkholderia sp. BL6665CI2N2]TDY26307.1 hypothetical protein B0G81_6817 [Paraburkholderia sp. BL6665CI2N2]
MPDYADIIQSMESATPQGTTPAAAPAAPQPAESANPYADIVRQMGDATQRTATDNLLAAQTSKPDTAARAMQVAPQVGVPAPAVEANLPMYEQQAQLQQNRQIMQTNPVLAQWVAANPPAARVAQDDFDNLDMVSKALASLKSGAVSAIAQNQLGRLYNTKQGAGVAGMATPDTDQQIKQAENTLAQQPHAQGLYGTAQTFSSFAAGLIDNIVSGAPEAAGGAAIGAGAGGIGAIPGAIAGGIVGMKADMARVSAGLTYRALTNVRDDGGGELSEPSKQIGALIAGALTYGVAGIGGGAAAKVGSEAIAPFVSEAVSQAMTRPTVAAALRTATLAAAKGGVQGAALNAAMDGAQILGEEAAKQISPGDFHTVFNDDATRQQAITRLADAAESGALLFGGMHGVGAGVHFAGDMLKVRQAQADMQNFQQLQDGAADSATRARSPDAFASFMQSQTNGTPVESLFVPAERIAQLYQSKGVDPTTGADPLFGWMPDMRKQMDEALPLGGDVVIPTADYLTHMAGTDVSRELLPDIRVRQDGMSLNDAKTFQQSATDGLARDAQQMVGVDDPVRQIYDDITKQAQDAGYTPDAAQQYGSLFAARYTARAERLGVDPMQLYREASVEIRPGDAPEHASFEQSGKSRSGAEAQRARLEESDPFLGFLGKHGVALDHKSDITGEKGRAGNRLIPGYGPMFRKNGVALDDLAQRAVQEHYLTKADIDAEDDTGGTRKLADMIQRAHGGEAIFPIDRQHEEAQRRVAEEWENHQPEPTGIADLELKPEDFADAGLFEGEADPRAVDSLVAALRDKLGDDDAEAKLEELAKAHENSGTGDFADALKSELSNGENKAEQQTEGTGLEGSGPVDDSRHGQADTGAAGGDGEGGGGANGEAQRESSGEGQRRGVANSAPGDGVRGSITLGNGKALIELFRARDLSTLLHESGHLWLEELRADAARPDAPKQLRDDFAAVRAWMGLEGDEPVKPGFVRMYHGGTEYSGGSRWLTPDRRYAEGYATKDGRTEKVYYVDIPEDSPHLKKAFDDEGTSFKAPYIHFDAPEDIAKNLRESKEAGGDIKVEHHEQFARAAEAYFMEGKAPSSALASAFSKFKSWLTAIYRSVSQLNTPINDDIRGVFDRLVATDQEIENARRAQHLRAAFDDPATAGMTEREFAEYQKTVASAGTAADSALLPKVMEHVRKKRTTDYEAYRAKVKAEVTREVDARPDIAALETLRTGQLSDGAEGIKIGKLSAKDIDAAYGEGTSEKMPKGTTVKRGGVHPDDMSDVLGFGSGNELVKALTALEQQERDIRQTPDERRTARQYIIDRRTDFRMSEERPDILTDGSIRDEAIDAIHNQEMQKALQIELRALGRRIHQEAFSADDVRQWAKDQIAGKTVRDVQLTGKYSRAEAIAARRVEQALVDGDHAGAYAAKRQQVLNHHLFVAARNAAEEIQSGAKELNRYAEKRTIKGISQEYLDQIHALLDRFDFGDASQKEIGRRRSLREWADRKQADGEEIYVPTELLNEAYQKHYSELTVDEFRGLRDTVENIAHIGKLKQTLLDGADERDFDSVVAEAVATADKLPAKSIPLERNPGEGGRGLDRVNAKWLNAKTSLRSLDASMLKMEQVFDWLDGHDSNGVFNRVVFRRLADAGVRENDLRSYVVSQMRALHDKLPAEVTKDWLNRYELPELKDSRTGEPSRMLKKDIIAMALNVGNDSNFAKLMEGEGWTRQSIWAVLNRHLTKPDWDFVQGSWDLIETLWPHIEAMEKRLSGVAPDKVRPTEVATPFGRYRGGYYPAIYDPLRAYDVELNRQRSGDRLFENNYTRATTDKGHTIERIQDYSRPLYLNLDVLPRHLTGVIHDLAYREAIMDADRFLGDERVREAVETTMGREIYKQFRPWLQAIANDKVYDQRGLAWWDRAAHFARTNATMVGLGFRFTTMMIHGGSALSNSIGEIGTRWMMSGIHAFDTPAKWAATRDFVFERSGEMRNRMNEVDRDVRDALREMEAHGNRNPAQKAYDGARRFAYYGISMLDMGSAMPTWVGAYNKGLHEGLSEQDAVYSADKAVRNAHGGGGSKDLSAIQRGPEFQKLFTMFYSFWNHFYNRQRDIGRRAGQALDAARQGDYRQARGDFAMVMARSWFYFVIPQLVHAALKPAASQKQAEQQSWPTWAAEEIGLGLMSGIPVFRDIANSAMSGRDYEATPAAQMVNSVLKSGKDIAAATGLSDHDVSDKWVKHAVQNAGYVFGLPTGQVSGSAQFVWDWAHGDQNPKDISDWLHGLVYGKVKE